MLNHANLHLSRAQALPAARSKPARWYLFVILCGLLLGGCASQPARLFDYPAELAETAPLLEKMKTQPDQLRILIQLVQDKLAPASPSETTSYRIREIHGRLLAAGLRRTLSETGQWGSSMVAGGFDPGAEVRIRATIIYSQTIPAALDMEVVDSTAAVWFRHRYEITFGTPDDLKKPDSTAPYQPLFETIAADLSKFRQGLSSERKVLIQQTAINNFLNFFIAAPPDALPGLTGEPSTSAFEASPAATTSDPRPHLERFKTYDDLLTEVISSYHDIYYEDLLKPYTAWLETADGPPDALFQAEQEILARQLVGIGSIVEAMVLRIGDAEPSSSAPLSLILQDSRFSRYSRFQPLQERLAAQQSLRELGLVTDQAEQVVQLSLNGKEMVLNGSVDDQYDDWRRMIFSLLTARPGSPSPGAGDSR